MTAHKSKIAVLKSVQQTTPMLSPTANRLKKYLFEQFGLCLKSMFDNADDLLFQMSEKAASGSDQARYFEAMRALRIRKKDIEQGWIKNQDSYLAEITEAKPDPASNVKPFKPKTTKSSLDDLSLVNHDDVEKTVAVESMANKAVSHAGDEWLAFRERMNQLLKLKDTDDKEYPFGPHQVADSFVKAIDFDDWEMQVKLILFKLFDQYVIAQLPDVYHEANQQMVEEHVLPDLDVSHLRTRTRRPPVNGNYLQNLMAARRTGVDPATIDPNATVADAGSSAGMAYGNPGVLTGGTTAGAIGGMPAVQQQAVIGGLSQLQNVDLPQWVNGNLEESLQSLKSWSQQQAQQAADKAKNAADSDTINLVAMLFQFILEERDLAAQMKQLLARLQIPFIKVAILDNDFFSQTEHPARRLLNMMARAATGWTESEDITQDPLLNHMEGIVQTLTKEFEDDLGIFDKLCSNFETLLDNLESKRVVSEQRLVTSEEARLTDENSKDKAREYIDELLKTSEVPTPAFKLLNKYWYQVMRGIHLKYGEGDQWTHAARIAKELLWSLQPGVTNWHRDRFFDLTPKLLMALRKGLSALDVDPSEINLVLAEVDKLHLADITKAREELDAKKEADLKKGLTVRTRSLEVVQKKAVAKAVEKKIAPEAKSFLDQVKTFEEDTWFELEQMDGQILRCKLLTVLGDHERYIFADTHGNKVAERSSYGLANAMKEGKIRWVDDSPLFELALDSVVDDLVAVS